MFSSDSVPAVRACLVGAAFSVFPCIAFSQSTWDGDTSANWSNAGNWDTAPAATGSSLVFAGSNNLTNNNDLVTGVNGITFASGAGSFNLGGNAVTVAGGGSIANNSTSAQTLSLAITNTGTTNVNAASGNISLTGLLGGGSLNIQGSGGNTVTLSRAGSNTFGMGATVANGGTLVLFNSSGNALSNSLTIENGGTVKLGGISTDQIHFNSVVTLNGSSAVFDMAGKNEEIGKLLGSGGTVRNDNATTATLTIGGGSNSSDFSNITLANGTGTLAVTTRNVANTYTFGGSNTYTGKTTIGGVANVSVLANGGVTSSIGASSNSSANLAISSTGVLRYTGSSTSTDRNFTTSAGAQVEVVGASTTLEFTGTSFGAFTKTGAGTLTLSGNVSSASAPSVTGGTLVLNAPGTNAFSGSITVGNGGTMKLGSASTGNMIHDNTPLTVNTGGTFDMGGQSEKFKSISGGGTFLNSGSTQSTLTVSGFSSSSNFDGVISGNIALTHTDTASSTTLNGLNTYIGNTNITNAGATLNLGATGGLTFYIGANGVNNWINGTNGATVNLDGLFTFNLTGADLTNGNLWNIVEVGDLTETFGSSFSVAGFTQASDVWTKIDGNNTWTFTESTGALSLAVIPEPSCAMIALIGLLAFYRRRR